LEAGNLIIGNFKGKFIVGFLSAGFFGPLDGDDSPKVSAWGFKFYFKFNHIFFDPHICSLMQFVRDTKIKTLKKKVKKKKKKANFAIFKRKGEKKIGGEGGLK